MLQAPDSWPPAGSSLQGLGFPIHQTRVEGRAYPYTSFRLRYAHVTALLRPGERKVFRPGGQPFVQGRSPPQGRPGAGLLSLGTHWLSLVGVGFPSSGTALPLVPVGAGAVRPRLSGQRCMYVCVGGALRCSRSKGQSFHLILKGLAL